MRYLLTSIRRFRSETKGSATVEAVLWLPLFFAIFGLMTNVAMIFNGHSRVMRVVQDANRNLSIGRLETENDTEEYIITALSSLSPNAVADTQIVAGVVTTDVTVPASDLVILNVFQSLSAVDLHITSQHLIEF
jgi:hypothetical protein